MKTRILFLCTGNSCRSQMAEGWAHHSRLISELPCQGSSIMLREHKGFSAKLSGLSALAG